MLSAVEDFFLLAYLRLDSASPRVFPNPFVAISNILLSGEVRRSELLLEGPKHFVGRVISLRELEV